VQFKIVAIINFWDGELLPYSINNWKKCSIDPMVIYSNTSNYGEITDNDSYLNWIGVDLKFKCEPLNSLSPRDNETRKRNFGLEKARQLGYTHFITADCDEFYEADKVKLFHVEHRGTVVRSKVYFKSPKLTIGYDTTLVPFIHALTPGLQHCFNKNYPFAWEGRKIRIDPTRSLNINRDVVMNEEIICHHYSYVRKDIQQKLRNSTARDNIQKSSILTDLGYAKAGYFCEFYKATLIDAEVDFGIPEMT